MSARYAIITTPINPTEKEKTKMLFQFTISQNKRELMSINDTNAVKVHTLVNTANRNAKYKKDFLTYTYKKLK